MDYNSLKLEAEQKTAATIEVLKNEFAGLRTGRASVRLLDGVRVEFDDGWLLMRKSVTAQQVTLRIEGVDEVALERIKANLAAKIPETAAVLK